MYKVKKHLYEGFNKESKLNQFVNDYKKELIGLTAALIFAGTGIYALAKNDHNLIPQTNINKLEKAIKNWDNGYCETLKDCYKTK